MEKLIILNAWESIVYNEMCQQFPNISSVTIEGYVEQASQIILDKPAHEFACGMLKIIVKRNLLDLVRRESRHSERFTHFYNQQQDESNESNVYQDSNLQTALSLTLNELNHSNRHVLLARVRDEKDYKTIGQELNKSEGAVRKAYSITCAQLRNKLGTLLNHAF
jgi:RNA polymerase sigma factor (sigma-70 family)